MPDCVSQDVTRTGCSREPAVDPEFRFLVLRCPLLRSPSRRHRGSLPVMCPTARRGSLVALRFQGTDGLVLSERSSADCVWADTREPGLRNSQKHILDGGWFSRASCRLCLRGQTAHIWLRGRGGAFQTCWPRLLLNHVRGAHCAPGATLGTAVFTRVVVRWAPTVLESHGRSGPGGRPRGAVSASLCAV